MDGAATMTARKFKFFRFSYTRRRSTFLPDVSDHSGPCGRIETSRETLTDGVYKKTGKLKLARRIVAAPSMLASAACLIPAATTHSASTAVICLTASLFFLEMVIGPAWAVPMDVGGEIQRHRDRHHEYGGSHGRFSLSRYFRFFRQRSSWIAPFLVTAGMLLSGALIWTFLIDPEKSVVKTSLPGGTDAGEALIH